MIIFDKDKYITQIKENGIGATDPYAKQKIQAVIQDFIANTTYKRNVILKKVKSIAKDYFNGLPDSIVAEELKEIFDTTKEKISDGIYENEKKIVTLYESEMRIIKDIQDDKLQRLAFSALVLHKYTGQYMEDGEIRYHGAVKVCDSDIFRIAHLDNVSGTTRNKLWMQLADKGLAKYYVKTNSAFRFNPSWIAIPLYTMPFNVDIARDEVDRTEFMKITNYDDIILYLRYYLGDSDVVLCSDCGCPVERERGKRFCGDCAAIRKKDSDKKRYKRNMAIA